jgi:hypothetical protein
MKGGEEVTLQDLLLGSIQSGQANPVMNLGANSASGASGPVCTDSFTSILESKVSTRQTAQNDNGTRTDNYPGKAAEIAAEPKYRTYVEARRAQRPSMSKTAGQSCDKGSGAKGEELEDLLGNVDTVSLVAQILGVNTGELRKLLDEAGIALEPLESAGGVSANAYKLSKLLVLDESSQKTLEELLQMARETLEALNREKETLTVWKLGYFLYGGPVLFRKAPCIG